MNTLAGGRGTGKSTIIEYLRYVLNRDRPEDFEADEDEIRRQIELFLQPKRNRDHGQTPGTLLPAHSITVDILVSGRKYRIKRSADGITYIVDPDSQNAEETRSLDVRHLITPRILSQRQIGRIARDPAAQRRELDNLAGQETINAFAEQRRSILEELEQLQVKRRQLKEHASTLPGKETELRTIQDQIAFLEKGGNKEVFDTYGACREEERWLNQILEGLDNREKSFVAESEEFEKLRELIGTSPSGPSKEWIKKISDRVRQKIEDWKNSLASVAEQIHKFRTELSGEKESVWQPVNQKAEIAYTQLQEAMQEHGVEFKQHQALLQRRALLDKQIVDLKKISGQQREIEAAITKVRDSLLELHQRRCETRRSLAALLEDQDADVRMDVHPFGHKESLREKRDEWFGGSGLQARDWDVLVDFIYSGPVATHLARMAECLTQDIDATLYKGRILERDESKVVSLLGEDDFLTANFFNALQRADRINVDAMECFLPEDAVETKVRDQEGVFKPIDLGSIGLKSTAVLSLLLAAKDQPLIIDQPEDDLDNHYVYTVVVNLLRKSKFLRQIIIATHNANIPVNGDAESIAAFEVVNRMGRLKLLGSIDRPDVKEEVSMIMEGSAEAFRLRRDRYGY
jgi:energy-coupling factor transporter ATP-binding protein EcfA2